MEDKFGVVQEEPGLQAELVKLMSLPLYPSICLFIGDSQLMISMTGLGCGLIATARPAVDNSQPESKLPFCLDPSAWQVEKEDLSKWLVDRKRRKLKTPRMTLTKQSFGNPSIADFVMHSTAEGRQVCSEA